MGDKWFDRVFDKSHSLLCDLCEDAESSATVSLGENASPIELAFLAALRLLVRVRFPEFEILDTCNLNACDLDRNLNSERGHGKIWGVVAPQVRIDKYRVDFVIRHLFGLSGRAGIVIECDGHDFHEKTKKQAAKDKARDRDLQQMGYRVFRYTGSEIWKDPIDCANEALITAHTRAVDSAAIRYFTEIGDTKSVALHMKWLSQ
jgi:very-short-patch-repair endonuclease